MIWDHNCVISAGLMSERLKRVCSAVRNDVMSRGEGGGGESANIDCKGMTEAGRAREKVCLRDEKPFEVAADGGGCWMHGDGGRFCRGGDVVPLRRGVELGEAVLLLMIFFLLNGRRKDGQSDSNWMDSNSAASGE